MKNGICILFSWLLIISAAGAAAIGQTSDALVIGGGARPLGMGKAFTAVVEDADAALINPAGLAGLRGPEAMSMFTNLLGEIYYMEFSGAVPFGIGTFGAGYITTGTNGVLVPISTSESVTSDYYDNLLVLSYGTALASLFDFGRGIYIGANAKIFNRGFSGLSSRSATGLSADFGIKYVVSPYLSFGFNRQNFLPVDLGGVIRYASGAEEAISGVNKLGVAVRPKPLFSKLLLAYDLNIPSQSGLPITSHFGAEWKTDGTLTVRAGVDQSVDAASPTLTSWNPTIGASLALSNIRIDYAYHPFYNNPSLATAFVSISLRAEPWASLTGETR